MRGLAGDDDRPDKAGMLVNLQRRADGVVAFVTIADPAKSGSLNGGPLKRALDAAIANKVREILVVNHHTGDVMQLIAGRIHQGRLLPPDKVEDLKFLLDDKPIGFYLQR